MDIGILELAPTEIMCLYVLIVLSSEALDHDYLKQAKFRQLYQPINHL